MNTHSTGCVLQLVHGYNEPFLSLSALYARSLREAGWRVVTVYLTGPADPSVHAASLADAVFFLQATSSQLRGLKLALLWRVRQLLRQERVTVLIAQRYKPLYLSLLASVGTRIPVLGVAHAFGVLAPYARRIWLQAFHHRVLLAGVSRAVTADLQQHAGRVRCTPLLNAIDTDARAAQLRQRDDARRALQLPADAFVFGNVGRLHPDKDQGTLIRAFAIVAPHFPQAVLVLIGQGRCESEYRALVDQLQLGARVHITGAVPDAPTLFPAFDAYVATANREPFGIVLCEAMLAQLPVISTDCGGAPEVLGDAAMYFTCGDVTALAVQLHALLEAGPALCRQRGEPLHRRVQQQFSPHAFCQRLTAVMTMLTETIA